MQRDTQGTTRMPQETWRPGWEGCFDTSGNVKDCLPPAQALRGMERISPQSLQKAPNPASTLILDVWSPEL